MPKNTKEQGGFKKPVGKPNRVRKAPTKDVKPKSEAVEALKRKAAEKEAKKLADEESSSSFDFDAESESASDSRASTDLSSSATDEMRTPAPEMSLDAATHKKLSETLEKERTPITEIKTSDPRGVVYLGHLPFGFFEDQMKKFFSQFGVVTRLRLSRNKKTGKSKHYAFVEFLDPVVAEIVADTMDGYMMLHRVLKCKVIPPEKVHPKMFKGANKRYMPRNTQRQHAEETNKRMTEERRAKLIEQEKKREAAKRKKIEELGLDYDFPSAVPVDAEARVGANSSNKKSPSQKRKRDSDKDGDARKKKAKTQ